MGRTESASELDGCCFQLRTSQPVGEDAGNNNRQSTFPKKARVDLSFENVRYTVKEWTLRHPVPVKKDILKGVSGIFPAGELTAIMGPSGAGKSTLLNVLAAFTVEGASGRVLVNGEERDPVNFKKKSCYIQQDDYLRKQLTVLESMRYASDLKLGISLPKSEKEDQITEILEMLGLAHCRNTPAGGLSGGQKKRLSIALELVSNPPILFLDEPTTVLFVEVNKVKCRNGSACFVYQHPKQGRNVDKQTTEFLDYIQNVLPSLFTDPLLSFRFNEAGCIKRQPVFGIADQVGLDSSSCSQCISLLKFLAQQGRTVVCTIHQPSSLVFEMFDNLYALAEGHCIYSGKIRDLVPYLATFDLHCPLYHSPADFLLDVAVGEFEADLEKLTQAASKQVLQIMEDSRMKSVGKSGMNNNQYIDNEEDEEADRKIVPASCLSQTCLLLRRKLLIMYRSPTNVLLRAMAHLIIGGLFGYLYWDAGQGANTVLANYVYLYGSNLFLVYTGKMSATLMFPLELLIVTREHFNRWYKLVPYYLSMMIIEIPFQILCCIFYLPLSYYLTGQPQVCFRFLWFCGSIILLSLVSQAVGFLIGILTPRKIAVFIGPVLACLLSVFGFCLRYSDTPSIFKWLYHISYFRAAFQVSVLSVYGMDREKLYCPPDEDICKFSVPARFLQEMDTTSVNIEYNTIYTAACFFLAHILTIIVVWYRLTRK